MPALDETTLPGEAGLNFARQKALLVTWLLVTANDHWSDPTFPLVKSQADLNAVNAAAAAADAAATAAGNPAPVTRYIDMRNIYPQLPQLATAEVDNVFALARANPEFKTVGKHFWDQGVSLLSYPPPCCCLAMTKVLAMNT